MLILWYNGSMKIPVDDKKSETEFLCGILESYASSRGLSLELDRLAGSEELLDTVMYSLMDKLWSGESLNDPVLCFKSGKSDHELSCSDILYVKSSNHNVAIVDTSCRVYSPRMTYSSVYGILGRDGRFLQINRGILVNMEKILSFSAANNNSRQLFCELEGGIRLPVSINHRKQILAKRQEYISRKMHSEMGRRSGSQ